MILSIESFLARDLIINITQQTLVDYILFLVYLMGSENLSFLSLH